MALTTSVLSGLRRRGAMRLASPSSQTRRLSRGFKSGMKHDWAPEHQVLS
jgi:hypothetical protein